MNEPGAELGLTAYEVAVAFPFHLGFDSQMRILQIGPALGKVAPGIAPGQHLDEYFRVETPAAGDFKALCESPSSLVLLRAVKRDLVLRGQTIWYPRQNALLFLCSPWLTSTAELHRHGLSLADFAVHDPMADLLQVLQAQEATLLDVRKLVSKLSLQRKEQRAAGARMEALYEITRILAAGASMEEVAQQVLEQTIGILRLPVTSLWLQDSTEQFACVAPGAGSAAAHALAALLRALPPDHTVGAWLPTDTPLVRRFAAAAAVGGRTVEAAACGFPVAYQIQIEGAAGMLGAFEAYGVEVPAQERLLLDTMAEVALRLGQFIDKTRADAALRSSIKVAAAAAAAKSQFLARMSHEIRTPINGVLGMIELTLSTSLTPTQRGQLETARSSGELLLGLVNDVLDFSKIEAGHLEIEEAPFDLMACLQRAYKLFEARAAAKKLLFELIVDPRLPQMVSGDELRLSQVLVNLIGNALKFTKAGSISVAARLLSDDEEGELSVGVEIRDTGIGIPEARREAIFSAFTQAELATAREFGGTGLGLTICKQLVELMGGELTVTSEVGKGSTFRFYARLGRVHDLHQEPARSEVVEHQPAPESRALHVLVVEDNEINQAVVRGLLERDRHTVEIADRMDTAIARGCEGSFDAILMDIQLPDGDGLVATTAIRAHQRRQGRSAVPIIGLSAQAVTGDRERALAAGMDEYLTKPVRPAQLSEVLRRLAAGAMAPSRRRRTTAMRLARGQASEVEVRALTGRLATTLAAEAPAAAGAEAPTPAPAADGIAAWTSQDERAFLTKVSEYADLGEMIFTMARSLAADAALRLPEIERKLSAGDHARVIFLVHSLAGSSGTIGFGTVERAARAIEQQLRSAAAADVVLSEVAALRRAVQGLQGFVDSSTFAGLQARAAAGPG